MTNRIPPIPTEPDPEDVRVRRATFAPGSCYEGLRAHEVGRVVQDALFGAMLRRLTIDIALEADDLHVTLTVIEATPETRPRGEYDD